MHSLLKGVRVVDLTTIVLGPYATRFLADMGADVIKVEPPAGDLWRSVRPGHSETMGAGFLNCNRNKRSVSLDLTRPEGREALGAIIKTADAIIHNMRPKAAAKLGASYEHARAIKPDIVYCYAAGFGQDGPNAEEPAYDDTIQAASGLAYLNANAEGEPRFLPTIVCDKVGGLHLAMAALAGLLARARTGEGCCIEAPMFESMVSFLMVEQLAGQSFRPPLGGMGYDRLLSPNRKPFRTADGFISILPYNAAHWSSFLTLVGRNDLAKADWVIDSAKRSENVDRLYQIIGEATPRRTTEAWLELLHARDIPCSRVNKMSELLQNEHLAAVAMFEDQEHATEGALRSVRSPFRVTAEERIEDTPGPSLGQHTKAVLAEAGLSDGDIARLVKDGAAHIGETVQ